MPKDVGKSTSKQNGRGKLTDKQQRFVEEYLIDLNATQAAIRAGYSEKRAAEIGYQQLQKTTVQEAIEKAQNRRSERVQITQDDVLKGLLDNLARCTGQQTVIETELMKTEDGIVSGIDIEKKCFEPHAANKALELLGKHLGMFGQKVDLSSSDGSIAMPTVIQLVAPNVEQTDE